MNPLQDVKVLVFLCMSCLLVVVYGGVIIDECTSVQEKPPPLCCRYGDENNDEDKEEEMERNMKLCLSENVRPEFQGARADQRLSLVECIGECVFNYSRLLTPDFKLNKEAIMNMDEMVDEDPRWKAIDEAALKMCFDKIEGEIDETTKCKSGSYQFVRCIIRERFFNCPKDLWTESDECTEYRNVIQRCTGVIPELYE